MIESEEKDYKDFLLRSNSDPITLPMEPIKKDQKLNQQRIDRYLVKQSKEFLEKLFEKEKEKKTIWKWKSYSKKKYNKGTRTKKSIYKRKYFNYKKFKQHEQKQQQQQQQQQKRQQRQQYY